MAGTLPTLKPNGMPSASHSCGQGFVTLNTAAGIGRNDASFDFGLGGCDVCPGSLPSGKSLKVMAADCVRLTNSQVTRATRLGDRHDENCTLREMRSGERCEVSPLQHGT